MKNVRLGIFGMNRGFDYADSFLMAGATIVAVCDTDKNRLKRATDRLGEGKVALYEDFDKFIEHDMDAVVIANCFHEHTPYVIKCLERNIHVFCECTAAATMADCVKLVRACEKSDAIYMLAENYPFMKFNKEMKRVCDGGTLGRIMYAEGEYNHPVGPSDEGFLRTYLPYPEHWRNFLPRSYYITHSLAPIMHMTGAFPVSVTAAPVFVPFPDDFPSGRYVGDRAAIVMTRNNDGSVFKVTGCAAFGAHGNSYRVCGENGQIENLRGMGDKVMLRYNGWNIPEGMQEVNFYEPEWNDRDEELIKKTGHGGGDFLIAREFIDCIKEGRTPDFDVYFATRMSMVAILAHRSILNNGATYEIPDLRDEEVRKSLENDNDTPFPGRNGEPATIPCCSKTDYAPTKEQFEAYMKMIGLC